VNEQELAALKSARGPSATLKADSERYMKESGFRKLVDDADAALGTHTGPKLKRIFYGQPEEVASTPQQPEPPTAIQVAAATKKYPRSRCHDFFKREANEPGESVSSLSKAEYAEAKLAGQFFGMLPADGSSASVKFVYPTSRDRAAARTKKEDAAKEVQRKQAEFIPPGITKYADGTLGLTDEAAFNSYKAEKAANAEAIKFLEDVA
jgi:hypothetical protein